MSKKLTSERGCKESSACSSNNANTKTTAINSEIFVEPKPKTTVRYDRISELAKPKFIPTMDHNKQIVYVRQSTKKLPVNKSVEQLVNREASSDEERTMNSKFVTGKQSATSIMRPPSICSQKTFVKTPCIDNVKAQSPSNSTVGCKIAWLNSQANEQNRETSINGVKGLTKSKGKSSTALIEHDLDLTQSGICNIPKDKSSDFGESIATDAGDTQLISPSAGVVITRQAAGDRDSRLDSKISFSEYLKTNENIKKWQEIRTEIPADEDNEQPESFVQEPWSRLQRLTQLGRGKVLAVNKICQRNFQKNYMENNADEAESLRDPFHTYGKQFVQPTKLVPDQRDNVTCQSRADSRSNELSSNGPHSTSTVENFSRSDPGSLKNRRDVKFLLSAENIGILKRKFEDMNNEDKNEQSDSIGSSKERHYSGIRIAKNGKSETETAKHSDKEQESPQQIKSLFFSTLWIQLPIICCFILGLVALFYFDLIIFNRNPCDRSK